MKMSDSGGSSFPLSYINAITWRQAIANTERDYFSSRFDEHNALTINSSNKHGRRWIRKQNKYYGSDAIFALALISRRSDIFNRLSCWIFKTGTISGILYPLLRFFANDFSKCRVKPKSIIQVSRLMIGYGYVHSSMPVESFRRYTTRSMQLQH